MAFFGTFGGGQVKAGNRPKLVFWVWLSVAFFGCRPVKIETDRSGAMTPVGSPVVVEVTPDPITPFALGQLSVTNDHIAEGGMSRPQAVYSDGVRLFVADTNNHRVLIYNSIPTGDYYGKPDVILGQPDNDSRTSNTGGVSAHSLYKPMSIHSDGTQLFVVDNGNNRILIWNSIPTTTNASADVVVGQSDFTSNSENQGGTVSASTFKSPRGVYVAGGKLIVSDTGNHRVLIFNQIPTSNGASADVVTGQPDFTSANLYYNQSNGMAQNTLYSPQQVCSDGTKLYVNQPNYGRIMVWETIPSTNFMNASLIIGSTSWTATVNPSNDASKVRELTGIYCDSTKLIVTDGNLSGGTPGGYRRVLIWNSAPTVDNQPADLVLGQPDFVPSLTGANNPSVDPGGRLSGPTSVFFDGEKLFVADSVNDRVLIWNSFPTSNGQSADVVVGKPTKSNLVGSVTSRFTGATHGFLFGNTYFLVDSSNNRILIWNSVKNTNLQPADVVLGQPDFYTLTANTGGISASTLNGPSDVFFDGSKLYVADRGNHRVLIWNLLPTTNSQPADVVLGQPNFTSNAANQGELVSAATLNYPTSVYVMGGRLFVADASNYRVVVWDEVPVPTGTNADYVIGREALDSPSPVFFSGVEPGVIRPQSIVGDGTKLVIADGMTRRILVWNTVPTTSVGVSTANVVIGQPDVDTANFPAVSSHTVTSPYVSVYGKKLFVSDLNNRVLVFNEIPTVNEAAADAVIGQLDFDSSESGRSANQFGGWIGRVSVDQSRIFIPDYNNHRVLVIPNLF